MISKKLIDLLTAKGFSLNSKATSVELCKKTPNGEDWSFTILATNNEEFSKGMFRFFINFDACEEYKKITGSSKVDTNTKEWKDQIWKADLIDRIQRLVWAFYRQEISVTGSKFVKRKILKILNDNDIYVTDLNSFSKDKEYVRLNLFTSQEDCYQVDLDVTKTGGFTTAFLDACIKQPQYSVSDLILSYRQGSVSDVLEKISLLADRSDELHLIKDKLLIAELDSLKKNIA